MQRRLAQVIRVAGPCAALIAATRPRARRRHRLIAAATVSATWSVAYARYRRRSIARTREEWDLLRTSTAEVFSRHYNECVPTVEEELDMWGDYHGHRHEMRYRLVADAVRRHRGSGATVLDIGCGGGRVAEELHDEALSYVGLDYGGHHITSAAATHSGAGNRLVATFIRGDAERLPFADASFDVVVMSEVIEHLRRPELATWEVARVLRVGGIFVMTTNNASELPLRFPLSDPLSFLEKAWGFNHDAAISHRPWVWPWPVDPSVLPPGSPPVWVPHTWHKQAETRRMLAAAGLETIHASTFEFPPPQSRTAQWLDHRDRAGRRLADAIEACAQAVPMVNRLGCHLFMVARRTGHGSDTPPPGVWPGPFSVDAISV